MKPDNVLADDVLQAALNKWQGEGQVVLVRHKQLGGSQS